MLRMKEHYSLKEAQMYQRKALVARVEERDVPFNALRKPFEESQRNAQRWGVTVVGISA